MIYVKNINLILYDLYNAKINQTINNLLYLFKNFGLIKQ